MGSSDHLDNSEILITPFTSEHLRAVRDLYESRDYANIESVTLSNLPKLGFVAYLGEQPVAAGFLRMVEGQIAYMDSLVSNSRLSSGIRHEAFKKVVSGLIEEARSMKLLGIIGSTSDEGMLRRAVDVGFKVQPHAFFTMSL